MLTYLDSGVFIAAARGERDRATRAMLLFAEEGRRFVASELVWLEVVPTAAYLQRKPILAMYDVLFGRLEMSVPLGRDVIDLARQVGPAYGLGGADAIHAAAAIRLGAVEFITTEKATKPFFRVREFKAISLT